MEPTHDEIAELLGAYALDAVEDDERRQVEAHLATCPRCAAEVADHREVAAMLAYTGAPAPEGIWAKIVETLEEPPPELRLPSLTATPTPPRVQESAGTDELSARRERRDRRPVLLGAAAAALVVVGILGGALVADGDGTGTPDGEVATLSMETLAREALNDPDATRVELTSPDDQPLSATAALEPDGAGYLLGTALPALDETETYQLWGIREETVVSLGVLGHSPDVVAFHLDPSTEALAITVEAAGGVPISENPALLVGNVV